MKIEKPMTPIVVKIDTETCTDKINNQSKIL